MLIKSKGYELIFIQTHPVKDKTAHLVSYIYKFYSPKTKLNYVLTADYHENTFFAIKFYAKKDKRSDNKYSKVVNKGDVGNILVTCAKVIPILLKKFPDASFGFIGSRTIDFQSDKIEGYSNNQRFRLYTYHLPQLIGYKTFKHKAYEKASSYVLLNNNAPNLKKLEQDIKSMVINTYSNILNVNI
jgi:hypothetical protein